MLQPVVLTPVAPPVPPKPAPPPPPIVTVWRVEQGTKKPVAPADVGTFFDGDTYLVLYERPGGPAAFAAEPASRFDVHVWVGKYSTPDEVDVALREAPLLDESVSDGAASGCHAIRWQTQGTEESAFLSLFPAGIQVKSGGVDSTQSVSVRLYHISGTRMNNAKKVTVPAVVSSLNEGDCFVADCGPVLYVFQGHSCSPGERTMASQEASRVVEQRPQARTVVVTSADAPPEFWVALGGKAPVATGRNAASGTFDATGLVASPHVYLLANGEWQKAGTGLAFARSGQPRDQTWLIDQGHTVVVRVGPGVGAFVAVRGAPAIGHGLRYLRERARHGKATVVRLVLGHEGPDFAQLR